MIGISFLSILIIFAGFWFLSCKLSHETAEEVARCTGRGIGRAAGAIFSSTDHTFDGSDRGVVVRRQDDFARQTVVRNLVDYCGLSLPNGVFS